MTADVSDANQPGVLAGHQEAAAGLDLAHPLISLAWNAFLLTWVERDVASVAKFIHADFKVTGLLGDLALGAQEYLDVLQQMSLLTELKDAELLDAFTDGNDRVSLRAKVFGDIVAAGTQGTINLHIAYRIKDDKILQADVMLDRLGLMEQMGALPENAFFIALTDGKFS